MGLFLYNLLLPVYLVIALPGLLVKMRRRGGYGAIEKTCVVGPEAGERIVAETLKLLNSHWDHQMRSKGSIQ